MGIEYLNNKQFESDIARYRQAKQDKARFEIILDDFNQTHINLKKTVKSDRHIEKEQKYQLIIKEYNTSANQLAADFFKIAEGIISYRHFNFVDTDDAIQEFVMTCFEKIERFDARKGKGFNYFSTLDLNAYRQLYRTARSYNDFKNKYKAYLETRCDQPSVRTKANMVAKDKFSRLT